MAVIARHLTNTAMAEGQDRLSCILPGAGIVVLIGEHAHLRGGRHRPQDQCDCDDSDERTQ